MRELAAYQVDQYPRVLKYPVGEALLAFEHRLREQAREQYQAACQIWAALAATGASKSKRPPEPPAILKDKS